MNALEAASGVDLDGDGDVGVISHREGKDDLDAAAAAEASREAEQQRAARAPRQSTEEVDHRCNAIFEPCVGRVGRGVAPSERC